MAGGLKVPIEGDVSPLLAEFAKLPGRTQQEMDAIARITEQEITRGRISKAFAQLPTVAGTNAKKAAAMVTKEMDRAAKDTQKSLGELKQGFGAVFGSGLINDIGDVGAAFGPVGLAAMGLGAAITGVGAAAYGATTFLYGAAEATGQLKDENRALDAAMGSVYQTIGNEVAPTFKGLTVGVIAGTLAMNDFVVKVFDSVHELTRWYDALGPVGQGVVDGIVGPGLRAATTLGKISDGFADGSIKAGGYTERALKLVGSLSNLDKVQHHVAASTKATTKATNESTAAVQAAYDLNKIMFADESENDRALTDQIVSNGRAIDDTHEMVADNAARHADDMRGAWDTAYTGIAGLVQTGTQAIIDGAENGSEAQKKAALVAFRAQQAAQIAMIAIQTPGIIDGLVLSLAPALGLAAIPVGIAAGIAQGALAAGAIASAPPPSFHTGGIVGQGSLAPDEQMVRARKGEEIRTRQQQQSSAVVVQVQQVYQHHVFDTFIADNLRQTNSPLRKSVAKASGRRIGHRSSR